MADFTPSSGAFLVHTDDKGNLPVNLPASLVGHMTQPEWDSITHIAKDIVSRATTKGIAFGVVSFGASQWSGMYDPWVDSMGKIQTAVNQLSLEKVKLEGIVLPPMAEGYFGKMARNRKKGEGATMAFIPKDGASAPAPEQQNQAKSGTE